MFKPSTKVEVAANCIRELDAMKRALQREGFYQASVVYQNGRPEQLIWKRREDGAEVNFSLLF